MMQILNEVTQEQCFESQKPLLPIGLLVSLGTQRAAVLQNVDLHDPVRTKIIIRDLLYALRSRI